MKRRLFSQTLKELFSKPKLLLGMIVVDLIFLVLVSQLVVYANNLAIGFVGMVAQSLGILIGYVLVVVLLYSACKFIVVQLIQSYHHESKLSFQGFGSFYILNLVLFGIIFVVSGLIILAANGIKNSIAPFTSTAMVLLFVVFSYLLVNCAHIFFVRKKLFSYSILHAARTFYRLQKLYPVLLMFVCTVGVGFLTFFVLGSILERTFFTNTTNLFEYGSVYNAVFVHGMGILFYLTIVFNRLYLYKILTQNKEGS